MPIIIILVFIAVIFKCFYNKDAENAQLLNPSCLFLYDLTLKEVQEEGPVGSGFVATMVLTVC